MLWIVTVAITPLSTTPSVMDCHNAQWQSEYPDPHRHMATSFEWLSVDVVVLVRLCVVAVWFGIQCGARVAVWLAVFGVEPG